LDSTFLFPPYQSKHLSSKQTSQKNIEVSSKPIACDGGRDKYNPEDTCTEPQLHAVEAGK